MHGVLHPLFVHLHIALLFMALMTMYYWFFKGVATYHLRKPDLQPGPVQYGRRPPLRAPVHGRGDS